jgi:hypothetical protein
MTKHLLCDICQQKMTIYTKDHKNHKFIDGKNYDKVCFCCCNVPKLFQQTYTSDGLIKEHKELEYCCSNIHSAKELVENGSADTLKEAKQSLEGVIKSCSKLRKPFIQKKRPDLRWNVTA